MNLYREICPRDLVYVTDYDGKKKVGKVKSVEEFKMNVLTSDGKCFDYAMDRIEPISIDPSFLVSQGFTNDISEDHLATLVQFGLIKGGDLPDEVHTKTFNGVHSSFSVSLSIRCPKTWNDKNLMISTLPLAHVDYFHEIQHEWYKMAKVNPSGWKSLEMPIVWPIS